MADIFVSYGRSADAQAHQVAEALRGAGYAVWRDDELPPHRAYSDVIEERIRSAKAVIVLWSAESVRSQWVRAEADMAREAGTLIQVTLDGALPPMPFNQIQCADLSGWGGDTGNRRLAQGRRQRRAAGRRRRPKPGPRPRPRASPRVGSRSACCRSSI